MSKPVTEQEFNGLSPEYSAQMSELLDANSPAFYFRHDTVDDSINSGQKFFSVVGACAVGVGTIDYVWTHAINVKAPVDFDRTESDESMDTAIEHVERVTDTNPDQIIVGDLYDKNKQVYNVSNNDGLARFVVDEISASELKARETEALTSAIDLPKGVRNAESDSLLMTQLREAQEAHVAQIPDHKLETTSDFTGEVVSGGVLLIVASVAGRIALKARRTRQEDRFTKARETINRELDVTTPDFEEKDRLSLAYAKFRNHHIDLTNILRYMPEGGGKRSRAKLAEKIQTVLDESLVDRPQEVSTP